MFNWITNKFKSKQISKQEEIQSNYYIVPEETFNNLLNLLNNTTCKLTYKIIHFFFNDFNMEFLIKIEGANANLHLPIVIQDLKINKDYKLSEANKIIISGYTENVISTLFKESDSYDKIRFVDLQYRLHPDSIKRMYDVKSKLYNKSIKLIEDYINNDKEFYNVIEKAKQHYIERVLVLINRYGLKQKDFANYELLK